MEMLKEEGWTDIGNEHDKCEGSPGQYTCHANNKVKESRIDYVITNAILTPAVARCKVDHDADYPTHRLCRLDMQQQTTKNHQASDQAY